MNSPIKVAVTGAAGQIGYSLLFGSLRARCLDRTNQCIFRSSKFRRRSARSEGVVMELHDCAFPAPEGRSRPTADLDEGFRDVNWALLVGSVPAQSGDGARRLVRHQRQDFHRPGQAIAKNAASDVRILVVGNPCNTNCLIAMNNAKSMPSRSLVCHDPPG